MKYPTEIRLLIMMGEILPNPETWDEDWICSLEHCKDLFNRLELEATFIEEDEGFSVSYADNQIAANVLLNAQMQGSNQKGQKLYAGDFPLLGILTGRSV